MAQYLHMPDAVDINVEFGRLPHTPPPNDKKSQATCSSPRRKRGWVWGGSKHGRSSSGLDTEEFKENFHPSTPSRRESIKNMFFTVRNGLLQYSQMPTEDDLKDCGPAQVTHQGDTQPKPSTERTPETDGTS